MIKKIISFIPNMLTLCNLLSGCIAVYMTFHAYEAFGALKGIEWAWIFIGIAALFDFFDGAAARLLKAYSNIGAELDSLADVVSFGVAPGMLMLNTLMECSDSTIIPFFALLIPAFGAYRLAKFNVDTTQSTSFRGLPIPANALFWIGYSAMIHSNYYIGNLATIALIIFVGWLMVSNIRMFSLKFKNLSWRDNFRRYLILAATLYFLIMWGICGLVWTIVLYLFISILGRKDI